MEDSSYYTVSLVTFSLKEKNSQLKDDMCVVLVDVDSVETCS